MANADRLLSEIWEALNQRRWFGKHVEEDAISAVYLDLLTIVNNGVQEVARVDVVQLADDWSALYVYGELVHEGHSISLHDLTPHLPALRYERIDWTEDQWARHGGRAPKLLEEV